MKRTVLFVFIIFMFITSLSAAPLEAGELVDGNASLGQDSYNMMWYLVGSGRTPETGGLFAVVRKYYTNTGIKNDTIELLMSKFGVEAGKAGNLNFTEYIYNYSNDFRMFAVGYIRHYDISGNVLHETYLDGLTEATKPSWAAVVSNGPSGLALAVARKNSGME